MHTQIGTYIFKKKKICRYQQSIELLTLVSITGLGTMATGMLILGSTPPSATPSSAHIYVSVVLLGIGPASHISTFARSSHAASRLGFRADNNTHMILTSRDRHLSTQPISLACI